MSVSPSSRFAFWLLERLGPQRESVIGDIVERFDAREHSSAWLWRQVLSTIVVGAVRDIREHKVLALTTVAVGFALIQAFAMFVGVPVGNLVLRHRRQMDLAFTVIWPVWSIAFVAIGAVISRMSRPAQGAMVLLFASVVLLAVAADQYGLMQDALEHSARSRLLLLVARDVTWSVSVLFGGILARTKSLVPAPIK